jgi:hypothetical protein
MTVSVWHNRLFYKIIFSLEPVQNSFEIRNLGAFLARSAKKRAFRFNLLATPKGFPLQSLARPKGFQDIKQALRFFSVTATL